jgi:hypothetical protein
MALSSRLDTPPSLALVHQERRAERGVIPFRHGPTVPGLAPRHYSTCTASGPKFTYVSRLALVDGDPFEAEKLKLLLPTAKDSQPPARQHSCPCLNPSTSLILLHTRHHFNGASPFSCISRHALPDDLSPLCWCHCRDLISTPLLHHKRKGHRLTPYSAYVPSESL